jgi:hypothetical protein
MHNYFIFIAIILAMPICWAQQTAIIEGSNKKVILNDDGTWKYADEQATQAGTVQDVYQAIVQGIKSDKQELFKGNCSVGFWEAKSDGGERMYRQAVRKKFDFAVSSKEENGDREVYNVEVVVAGKKVDRVFLFFIKQDGKWLLDGISENKKHKQVFLQGKVSGHFYPLDLPGTPDFEKIAMLIVEAAKNAESRQQLFSQHLTPDSEVNFAQVEKMQSLMYKSNHVWSEMRRAMIFFEYTAEGGKGSSRERAILYFRMVADKWQLYTVNSYASLETLMSE